MLATDRFTLRSDRTWEVSFVGSAWRPAVLATTPRMPGRGNLMAGGEGTPGAWSIVWPVWIFFGGLSIAIWIAGRWWFNRVGKPDTTALRRPGKTNRRAQVPKAGAADWLLERKTIVPLVIVAMLWMALFQHNSRLIPRMVGFDKHGHADYIDYIQKHWTPPLPGGGWEMFQPPLYYGISAVTLSTFGLSVTDEAGAMALRWLTMFFGIANIALVFLSLRLLFPGRVGRQMVGLLLAGFLPMQLYLSHCVTNETLAATLASATIFLCLRLVRAEKSSLAGYAGLASAWERPCWPRQRMSCWFRSSSLPWPASC